MIEKAVVIIEQQIGERIFRLELPLGAPFSECITASDDLHKQVIEMSQRQQSQPVEEQETRSAEAPLNAELTD